MRKLLSAAVVTALIATGAPLSVIAADDESIELIGTAYEVNMRPLPNAAVHIRSLNTGLRVSSTVSDAAGDFSFKDLQPGTYVIELVDGSGKVVGMSAPFRLGTAMRVNVSVVAVAQGTATSGRGAGFSLFGLGPVTSLAVVGAAGAAAVAGVVATRPDASPSR